MELIQIWTKNIKSVFYNFELKSYDKKIHFMVLKNIESKCDTVVIIFTKIKSPTRGDFVLLTGFT